MYVSVRGRIWLEAEALNMVESVGNYVKHRRVPIVVSEGGNFLTFFVPAISGESVAHAYQTILAEEMGKVKEKVCKYCQKGIFLKSSSKEVYQDVIGEKPPEAANKKKNEKSEVVGKKSEVVGKIESSIVSNCGVEDVGGFLYAQNPNVKRTSSFYTGYMVPVREGLKVLSIDPQLHSRYALGTKFVGAGEGESTSGQMIYYVELSSGLFAFSFDLDTKFIGKYTFNVDQYGQDIVQTDSAKKRTQAAIEALRRLLLEFPVGAKRTRFNPAEVRWDSLSLAVSNDVWTMPSSFVGDYMARALSKKSSVNYGTNIYSYAESECKGDKCYPTPEETVSNAINDALGRLK